MCYIGVKNEKKKPENEKKSLLIGGEGKIV